MDGSAKSGTRELEFAGNKATWIQNKFGKIWEDNCKGNGFTEYHVSIKFEIFYLLFQI